MKKTIVYTYGVFDIWHLGHVKLLEKAKKLGDYLIVGIVSDKAVREKKGKDRPVQNQKNRIGIMKGMMYVDKVILQKEFDPTEELKELHKKGIKVNILCKGNDWDYIPGQETIKALGGKLIKLQYSKKWSTTNIIKTIRERYCL
jgi:rfaE bifunctional protein nucleotidyltransferase chain/domain